MGHTAVTLRSDNSNSYSGSHMFTLTGDVGQAFRTSAEDERIPDQKPVDRYAAHVGLAYAWMPENRCEGCPDDHKFAALGASAEASFQDDTNGKTQTGLRIRTGGGIGSVLPGGPFNLFTPSLIAYGLAETRFDGLEKVTYGAGVEISTITFLAFPGPYIEYQNQADPDGSGRIGVWYIGARWEHLGVSAMVAGAGQRIGETFRKAF